MKKAVISDIDGSLIYRGHHLNKTRFPLMLKKLSDKDIAFCLATGRTYGDVACLFGDLLDGVHILCCDGALSITGHKIVHSFPIRSYFLSYFFDFAKNQTDTYVNLHKSFAIEFHGYTHSYIFTHSACLYHKEAAKLKNLKRISALEEIKEDIFKISLFSNSSIGTPDGLRICYDKGGITEYVPKAATKLSAAKDLSDRLGIPLSCFTAFGDSDNDAELLCACGCSYSTYCAQKEVFELTDHHTRDVIGTVIRLADEKVL